MDDTELNQLVEELLPFISDNPDTARTAMRMLAREVERRTLETVRRVVSDAVSRITKAEG